MKEEGSDEYNEKREESPPLEKNTIYKQTSRKTGKSIGRHDQARQPGAVVR